MDLEYIKIDACIKNYEIDDNDVVNFLIGFWNCDEEDINRILIYKNEGDLEQLLDDNTRKALLDYVFEKIRHTYEDNVLEIDNIELW